MNNQIFKYNGKNITFQLGNGDVMVNATEMAKPFNKQVYEYLRLPGTKKLISICMRKSRISDNQLVITKMGSPESGGGTWLHEDIALDFAQWLSIDFKLWCNDRIKELLKHGTTVIDTENPLQLLKLAVSTIEEKDKQLQEAEREKENLQEVNELQEAELKKSAPKVAYVDKVLQSNSTYTSQRLAKEFDMTPQKMHNILKRKGIIFRKSGVWMLYQKFHGNGYMKPKTHTYTGDDGIEHTKTYFVWTEKGRAFLHRILEKQLSLN